MTTENKDNSDKPAKSASRNEPPALHLALNKLNKLVIDSGGDFVFHYEFEQSLEKSQDDVIVLENISGSYRQEKKVSEASTVNNNYREVVFFDVPQYSKYHLSQQSKEGVVRFNIFEGKNYYELFAEDLLEEVVVTDFAKKEEANKEDS